MYYIIYDSKTQRILITKNMREAFEFIVINTQSKIKTINHECKPRILHRNSFLKDFLEKTKDHNRFFSLSKIMIKRRDNLRSFIASLDLLEKYDYYIENKNKL